MGPLRMFTGSIGLTLLLAAGMGAAPALAAAPPRLPAAEAVGTPAGIAGAALPPALFVRMSYTDGEGVEVLDAIDVAERVRSAPAGEHLVWSGARWVAARTVPAVAEALSRGLTKAPPALPDRWKYASGGKIEELTLDEIAARVATLPRSIPYVWRPGFTRWAPARDVPEVAKMLARLAPPPAPAGAASAGAAEVPDPAAAIRAHLSSLGTGGTGAVQAAGVVESAGPAPGEGLPVYAEPPPLPGEESQIEIIEIPPDQVQRILEEEGLLPPPAPTKK